MSEQPELYDCIACRDEGKETMMPADEVGGALMRAHLIEEHGYATAFQLRTCQECGNSVLGVMGADAPSRCAEHT